jgi:hypothetical protein
VLGKILGEREVEESINVENIYDKLGSEVRDMTEIKQPGRRYVKESGGERRTKREAREK